LNFTAVPKTVLSYFTAYPGFTDPFVSVMNSDDGRILANNAILAAGVYGTVTMYGSQPTDIIVDVNGYFDAPGGPGALDFYPMVPCRVADTRNGFGAPQPNAERVFDVKNSPCNPPAEARAYFMNLTAVPLGPLPFVTAYPTGGNRPLVSTLNSFEGNIVANGAIIPASAQGKISVFTYTATGSHVVLDLMGYFAP
jgi:serine protease